MIDVKSLYDADKILRASEEIVNFAGSNVNGVGHQVQQVFLSGVHHDWTAAEPNDPWEKMDMTVMSPKCVKL